jgi:pyrimidine-nucleoside phosphorylase
MKSVYELTAAKRDGGELTEDEIAFLVNGFTKGDIQDYQMSSFLMAAFVNGLSVAETAALTHVMLHSGEIVTVSGLDRPLLDKHSTGGVGDKLTLTMAPLLANCGVAVGMFSGRGLGHTGGTLDKLEAIPGMRVFHSRPEFARLLKKHHFAICGQTDKIAPADKRIYALRDATGTVESIPLIVASIMSKKLALKSNGILFDVKTGSGAFMKTRKRSQQLADALLAVARDSGLPACAVITNMNQPTGRMIGNFLEISETIDVLRGEGPADTVALTIELSAEMLLLAGIEKDAASARKLLKRELKAGRAYESFLRYVVACGGDAKAIERPDRLIGRAHKSIVKSPRSGYIKSVATDRLGYVAGKLGAGRSAITDRVDPLAGIEMMVRIGSKVSAGEPLGTGYAQKQAKLAGFERDFIDCLTFSAQQAPPERLVLKHLRHG